MSYYSDGNVQTHYIDPSTYIEVTDNSAGRVSFELDGTKLAFLPNMRLLNIGCTSDALHVYNRLVGSYVMIDRIRLLDGDTELSGLTNQQLYRGFLNQNAGNSANEAVDSKLSMTSLGWSVEGINRQLKRTEKVRQTGTTVAAQVLGFLDLRELFPILGQVSHLPTSVFKNLNIQITMSGKVSDQILYSTTAPVNGVRPILAVDVLENPAIVANMRKGLTSTRWLEVEHDRFFIPRSVAVPTAANNQLVVQQTNVKINGFNNKHVERLLIVKELVDNSTTLNAGNQVGWGRYGSPACFREQMQYRLNGRNVLPRNGIVGNNERLAYLIDTYGDCSNYPGSNQYGLGATGAGTAINQALFDAAEYVGKLDYNGIYLGDYINDLQLNYQRTNLQAGGLLDENTNVAMFAHVYAEVAKTLMIRKDGSYNIMYSQN